MPDLRARETSLRHQIDALDAQLADREVYLKLADDLEDFLAGLRGKAATATVAERQRVLRLLVKDVLVGPEKITIRHRIPVRHNASSGTDDSPETDSEGEIRPDCQLRWRSHLTRCWPTCSCITRSTRGWPGNTRTVGSSVMRMTWSCTAPPRRRPARCGPPSPTGWPRSGLELHPDKTRDRVLQGREPAAALTRTRRSRSWDTRSVPQGPEPGRELFLAFLPAISKDALNEDERGGPPLADAPAYRL